MTINVSKVIGVMHRIKLMLKTDIFLTQYNSLIMPHFNNCILAWGQILGMDIDFISCKKIPRIIDDNHYKNYKLCK